MLCPPPPVLSTVEALVRAAPSMLSYGSHAPNCVCRPGRVKASPTGYTARFFYIFKNYSISTHSLPSPRRGGAYPEHRRRVTRQGRVGSVRARPSAAKQVCVHAGLNAIFDFFIFWAPPSKAFTTSLNNPRLFGPYISMFVGLIVP